MRYLAAGSEDPAAALYDLRQGSLLLKLGSGGGWAGPGPGGGGAVGDGAVPREHRIRGAAADVAWHPLRAQVAVGSMDGHVSWFGV